LNTVCERECLARLTDRRRKIRIEWASSGKCCVLGNKSVTHL